ncbi:MAG: lysostaphin resistance A-like protein, partial [Planctomycetota bacterium]
MDYAEPRLFRRNTPKPRALLTENSNVFLQALVVIFAVCIVPVFEEMLFRGFLQTSIRSLTGSSAIAILISSALFVILHQPHHWLALMA